MDAFEEISGVSRAVAGIHSGKGDLAIYINAGEDIPPVSVDIEADGVQGDEEAGTGFLLELDDAFLETRPLSFGLGESVLLGMVVELMLGDHPLDLPGGDTLSIGSLVYDRQLHLAIADVSGSQGQDSAFFFPGDLPCPGSLRSAALLFQAGQVMRVVSLPPFVQGLGSNSKVAAGLGNVAVALIMVHPAQPVLG